MSFSSEVPAIEERLTGSDAANSALKLAQGLRITDSCGQLRHEKDITVYTPGTSLFSKSFVQPSNYGHRIFVLKKGDAAGNTL